LQDVEKVEDLAKSGYKPEIKYKPFNNLSVCFSYTMKSHIQESMVNSYGKFFVVNFRHLVKNIF
jgi:hypothetical protein